MGFGRAATGPNGLPVSGPAESCLFRFGGVCFGRWPDALGAGSGLLPCGCPRLHPARVACLYRPPAL
eukprot:649206-Lingulodinium_polyedra.AAC.1